MATRITEATEIQALPPMFAPGSVLLGRYQVEAQLGIGGCGFVLRAHDRVLRQPVAIKILRTDVLLAPDMEARLMREARVIAQLTSQHVVRIFDVGLLEHGAPFMVMELLHGADLGELVARGRAIAPAVAVDYVLQACDALAEAHALGIVHRDVKPSNLFVVASPDGSELVKVLDFGISKAPTFEGELSLTHTASVLGTPAYMSPEQMRSARAADARSDLWALGTVLYELVEGHLPISAGNFAELVVMASTQPYEPMVVAPQLAPVIARCLAKTPDARYASVAELAAELARFTDRPLGLACVARTSRMLGVTQPVEVASAASSATMTPHAARSRRRIAFAGAVVAGVLALTAAMVIVAAPRSEPAQPTRLEQPPAAVAPPRVPPASVAPADRGRTAPVVPADPIPAPPPPVESRTERPATRASPPVIRVPAKRTVARRKPSDAGSSAGCDPYARPEGC